MPLTTTVLQSTGKEYTTEPITADVTATPAVNAAASQNGWSQYGGGGGVGYFGTGAGTSVFGGNGATNAVAAAAPGGGGAYATNTAGARGEARYWGIM